MRKVVVARNVWARTCRRPSLVECGRILQWDLGSFLIGGFFFGRRLITVANGVRIRCAGGCQYMLKVKCIERNIPWLVFYVMIVRMSKASKSHDHQLHKEQDEDRHETDTLHPWVLCDRTRQTPIGQGFVGRCQQL